MNTNTSIFQNLCKDFVLQNVELRFFEKMRKSLDVIKDSWKINKIDQIDQNSLNSQDSAPVKAIYLANIINLSIKLATFVLKYKIGKTKIFA